MKKIGQKVTKQRDNSTYPPPPHDLHPPRVRNIFCVLVPPSTAVFCMPPSAEATEEEDSIDGTSPTTATTAEDQASSTAQTIATAAAGEAEKDNTAQNGGEVDGATAAAAAEEVESAREQASEAAGADAAAAAATAGDLENNIDEIAAAGQGLEERTEEVLLEKTGNGVGDGDIEASDGEESGSGSTYDSDVDRAWMEFEGRGEGRLKAAEGSLKGALRSYDKLLREHYLKMSFVQVQYGSCNVMCVRRRLLGIYMSTNAHLFFVIFACGWWKSLFYEVCIIKGIWHVLLLPSISMEPRAFVLYIQ